jgi:glutamyl-tRNA reductase
MTDTFIAVGVNHETGSLQVREKIAKKPDEVGRINAEIKALGFKEAVFVSTCSRCEVFAVGPADGTKLLSDWFSARAGKDLSASLYAYAGRDAVRHLLRVVSGLDSWVLGETEILGQVKTAYIESGKEGATGRISNIAFQHALRVGKKVRSETKLVGGIKSIGGAAAMLARKIFASSDDKQVIIFGAGTMAETTVSHLCAKGIGGVWVANRSLENAESLANRLGGKPIGLEEGMKKLEEVDIAVFSTGARDFLLSAKDAEELSKKRKGRSLFVIDIALPRNVDPRVGDADDVYLYDLEDLRGVVKDSLTRREEGVEQAMEIVNPETNEIWGRLRTSPPPNPFRASISVCA